MRKRKNVGEMTEPWNTQAWIKRESERKLLTLIAIDLTKRKLPFNEGMLETIMSEKMAVLTRQFCLG